MCLPNCFQNLRNQIFRCYYRIFILRNSRWFVHLLKHENDELQKTCGSSLTTWLHFRKKMWVLKSTFLLNHSWIFEMIFFFPAQCQLGPSSALCSNASPMLANVLVIFSLLQWQKQHYERFISAYSSRKYISSWQETWYSWSYCILRKQGIMSAIVKLILSI